MATLKGNPDLATDEMLAAMNVSREYLRGRNAEKARLNESAPRVGDRAPVFTAPRLAEDGSPGDEMRLSDLLSKPVGLLFGSYTCPIFRNQLARYEQIHQALWDRINFLCVYILEAHPEDGWRVPHNWDAGICIPTPQSLQGRAEIASLCRREQGLTIPMVMDTMSDELLTRYAGSPERLYAIDTDGTVAHQSSIGPFDDDDVEAWAAALKKLSA